MTEVRKPTVRQRWRYWFDNTMARGTPALIGWLTLFCLVIVVPASAALVWADKNTPTTLTNQAVAIWKSIGSTFKLGGAVGTPAYVALSVLLALVALFFASTLVGLITTGVNRKIMSLRLGRSAVIEERHTVVLGWSDQVFPIVSELVEANANHRRAAVAILADRDKLAMESDIHTQVPETRSTRVICRTGDTCDPAVIGRVGLHTARSVLVVTPADEDGDAQVIRTLLAVNSDAGHRGGAHLVAAVRDGRHHAAACLAAGPDSSVLNIDDTTARLIVQTSRQPGLSLVYEQLLDFAGDEFYTVPPPPDLVGRAFGEALLAYRDSSVVGLVRADGTVAVNPPAATTVRADDLVVVVAGDDDAVEPAGSGQVPEPDETAMVLPVPRKPVPERILLLGWNRRAPLIIEQLDGYVAAGSALDVVARGGRPAEEAARITPTTRLKVDFRSAATDRPEVLAALDVASYDSVVVLGYEDEEGRTGPVSDGETLVTLLHLRALEQAMDRELPVVTEMADDRSRALAPISAGADFIVSGKIISLLMTQVAENRRLAGLFRELGNAEGSEIYLKPAGDYVRAGQEVSYATVVESARRQGQCAIGYRLQSEAGAAPGFGVRLNPDKARRVTLGPGDSVVVVAAE
ncbi:NAD-binding lipoprotein [Streptomyces sp. NPDC059002]|uniref:CASTOR/POLLUX-related putative ion channel n=1 Tax=Streptomyces sp. NPDC059002 TaxID=3346690 RepID=UPI003687D81C